MNHDKESRFLKRVAVIGILLILVAFIFYHIALPLLGISLVLTAGVWSALVITVAIFGIGGLLLFLLPAIAITIIALFVFAWLIVAIILFPILFPIFIPLLILLFLIAHFAKRRRKKETLQ